MYVTRRIFTILFIILFIFSCKKTPTNSEPAEPVVVTFPDANFEALIRDVLNKPDGNILTTDLLTITQLIGDEKNIIDITGIENCSNLDTLDLAQNTISDISLLSTLTKLTNLDIGNNPIIDISALSNLTNLTLLYIYGTEVTDISALSNLTNLLNLKMHSIGISNKSDRSIYGDAIFEDIDIIVHENPKDFDKFKNDAKLRNIGIINLLEV